MKILTAYQYPDFCFPFPPPPDSFLEPTEHENQNRIRQNTHELGLGIGEYGTNNFKGAWENFNLYLESIANPWRHGINIHGGCRLKAVTVAGQCGNKQLGRESFGVFINNLTSTYDIPSHLSDLVIMSEHENAYCSGVSVGLVNPRDDKTFSAVLKTKVLFAKNNHAGFIFNCNVVGAELSSSGVAYAFYCDTGPMAHVTAIGGRHEVRRGALGIVAASDKFPDRKGDIIICNQHFVFVGPGPHYALEIFDPLNNPFIRNIKFIDCIFDTEELILVSASGSGAQDVQFINCAFPNKTSYHLPKYHKKDTFVVNGERINERLPEYKER